MKSPLAALFVREFAIARRIGGGGSMGVVFLLLLVTIVPFAIGPDLNLLRRFLSDKGKTRGRRVTGLSRRHQRQPGRTLF